MCFSEPLLHLSFEDSAVFIVSEAGEKFDKAQSGFLLEKSSSRSKDKCPLNGVTKSVVAEGLHALWSCVNLPSHKCLHSTSETLLLLWRTRETEVCS